MTTKPIALEMTACATGHRYIVRFYGPDAEAHALAFYAKKAATHAISEVEGEFIDQGFSELIRTLYPLCEHGMSADLCSGPQHYAYDDEERAYYGY